MSVHTKFSQIVCSHPSVLGAFDTHRPTRLWWRIVLALHGKPVKVLHDEKAQRHVIVNGFRFYVFLYRALAVICFLVMVSLVLISFWLPAGVALLGGAILWNIAGLGAVGVCAYDREEESAITMLLAFLGMLMAFLSLLLGAIGAQCFSVWGVSMVVCLCLFGVGSYAIEAIYLLGQGSGVARILRKDERNQDAYVV
jgi:hypothetical protein